MSAPATRFRLSTFRLTGLLFVLVLLSTACGPRFDRTTVTVAGGVPQSSGDGGFVDSGGGDPGFVEAGGSVDGSGDGSFDGTSDGGTVDGSSDGSSDGGTAQPGSEGGTSDSGSSGGTSGGSSGGTSGGTSGGSSGGTSGGSSGGTSGGSTTPPPAPADKGSTQGLTDTTIKLGYLLPLTGAAPVPAGFDDGVRVFWKFLNDQGGINGRKVDIIIYDTESTTSNAVAQARKAVQQDKVFTLLSLDRLEVQDAIAQFLEQVGMPHVMVQSPASPPSSWKNTFVASVDHIIQGRGIATFMAKDLKAGNGGKKVAFVREQTNALKPGTDAFEVRAAEEGMEVVSKQTINPADNNQAGTVNALVASGAEIVWLYMAPTVAANIISSAGTRGYQPIWFANTISWNFELMHAVTANFLNGSYAFSSWVPLNDKRAAKYKSEFRRQISDPSKNPDDIGLVGWGAGEVISDVLRDAGKELGWNTFRSALQNFNAAGNVWTGLDFRNGFVGSNVVKVYKSNGSEWSLFQDERVLR